VIALGGRLVGLIDQALELDGRLSRLVVEPTVLFRVFAYPPHPTEHPERWGVGEHTDYGLLTLLAQDAVGGLSVRTRGGWVAVPPIEGSYVCNIGDMLERATGGQYRSTPHRARNASTRLRLSFPLFFDPGWDTRVERYFEPPVESAGERSVRTERAERWDAADPLLFEGTYGEYVWSKVGKVFPGLHHDLG
ncbi:MAG: isopenicillin N synthase family oxygenase, partial [Actinobacteria bacterium]|nr:isopenicillin N synthase family oxygenase [Actinomycetota bacterium]